jgi:hypothetical protein
MRVGTTVQILMFASMTLSGCDLGPDSSSQANPDDGTTTAPSGDGSGAMPGVRETERP